MFLYVYEVVRDRGATLTKPAFSEYFGWRQNVRSRLSREGYHNISHPRETETYSLEKMFVTKRTALWTALMAGCIPNSLHASLIQYSDTNATVVTENLSFVTDLVTTPNFHGSPGILVAGPQFLAAISYDSTGNFSPAQYLAVGKGSEAVVSADLNGDGNQDLVVASSQEFVFEIDQAVSVLPSDGAGSFSAKKVLVANTNLPGLSKTMSSVNGRDLQVADMNGDASLDIVAVVTDDSSSSSPSLGYLLLLENDGTGNFSKRILLEDLQGPAVLEVADMDGDGFMDIVVVQVDIKWRKPLRLLYGKGDGTFRSPVMVDSLASGNMAIAVGDVNADGRPDILTLGLREMIVYLGSSSGTFQVTKMAEFNAQNHLSVNHRDWRIEARDVDDDGLTDIVACFGLRSELFWMKQRDSAENGSAFDGLESLVSASTVGEFLFTDLNKDGVVDILVHSELDATLYAFYGEGEATVAPTTVPTVPASSAPPTPSVPLLATDAPTPTLCVELYQPCSGPDADCCGDVANVFCSGICKARRTEIKHGASKLYINPRDGGSRRKRALKGSSLRAGRRH